jgi:putative transposase
MPKKWFQPKEIIGKPRHADVRLGQGKRVAEVVKALGIAEVTYYRWRQGFGGPTVAQAWPLKQVAQAASGEAALQ